MKNLMKKFVLVVMLFVFLALVPRSSRAQAGAPLVDSEWVIAAGKSQAYGFSTKGMSLQATVVAVKNGDKGFRVRVVNAEDIVSCTVSGGTCRELVSWRQLRTHAFTQTAEVPAGNWAFLVENSENIFKALTVHVVLVTN